MTEDTVEVTIVDHMIDTFRLLADGKLVALYVPMAIDLFSFTRAVCHHSTAFAEKNADHEELQQFITFLNQGAQPIVEKICTSILAMMADNMSVWVKHDIILINLEPGNDGIRINGVSSASLADVTDESDPIAWGLKQWWNSPDRITSYSETDRGFVPANLVGVREGYTGR